MRKKTMLITGAAAAAVVLGGATVAGAASNPASDDQPLSGTELQQASDAALAKTGGGTVLKAEADDGAYEVEVQRPDGARVEVGVDRSFQTATVEGADDDDFNLPALSAADRDQAANAALAAVGQGTVSEVERENEGGAAYEVEVRLPDGSQVEVQVGADFQVLRQDGPEFDD